jgi:hypothetical protein
LKNSILVGLIAGFAAGIVNTILMVGGLFELFSIHPYIIDATWQIIAQIEIMWGIIWGVIFGLFYALFYDYVPSKRIKKGLVYGFIIWIIVFVREAFILYVYGYAAWLIPGIISNFLSYCIVYGLLIGILYKK